jgi:hypothetical protein
MHRDGRLPIRPQPAPPPAGARVVLERFQGCAAPPEGCRPDENYWLLVGAHGTVLAPPDEAGRVLVRFDLAVDRLGLQCHNPVPNTLLIRASDLGWTE